MRNHNRSPALHRSLKHLPLVLLQVAAITLLCGSPLAAQFAQNVTVTAAPSPGQVDEAIVLEIRGEAPCVTLFDPSVQEGLVRYRFSGHCVFLPPDPSPFKIFALLPPLPAGEWRVEILDDDSFGALLAATEVRILDPNFSIAATPALATANDNVTITITGVASAWIQNEAVIDGSTIRFDGYPCPICDPPPPVAPFTVEQILDPLPPGTYDLELTRDGQLLAVNSFEVLPLDSCVPNSTTLCLGDGGRFRVTASWELQSGASGPGIAIEETDDTGMFWFFEPNNVELVVKALDACSTIFQSHWLYAAGLTDVGVTLEVTDTLTDETQVYENPAGRRFVTITDTEAFKTCP